MTQEEILCGQEPWKEASFTLKNRCCRALWALVYVFLFRPTPWFLYAWRSFLLRLFGANIASGCHVYPSVRVWAPWNLVMESEACLGPRVECYNMNQVILKRRAIVSQGAHLCTGTHDYKSPLFQLITKPISIGAEAWVCTEAFIGPGVDIGDRAVIGARSVCLKSMPEGKVCSGHPCVVLKDR